MVMFLCVLVTFTSEFLFLRQWHIHIMTNVIKVPSLQTVHVVVKEQSKVAFCAFKHAVATKTARYFALWVLDLQHEGCQLLMEVYQRHAVSKVNTV